MKLILFFVILSITITINSAKSLDNQRSNNGTIEVSRDQAFIIKLIEKVFDMFNIRRVINGIKKGKINGDGTCYACKFGISLVKHMLEFGKTEEEIAKLGVTLCTQLRLQPDNICKGIVKMFEKEFFTVISNLKMSPIEICGILLGSSCSIVHDPIHNWSLPLTPVPKPKSLMTSELHTEKRYSKSRNLKFLHISDTHADPEYKEGSIATCNEPLCCRAHSTARNNVSSKAGYWGDYRDCDIPIRTLEAMLVDINRTHSDIDYVIWTGDIPPHDIWNQSEPGQVELIRSVSKMIDKYLGEKPIFPAIGNHESSPVNSFPPPELAKLNHNHSVEWLYEELEDIWSKWLPDSTRRLIIKGAFYSVKVHPGLRLISLNTNYCNNQNMWLLINTTDPGQELSWLINELQSAELLGEKVHLIGHIPPGHNDCLEVWSRNFHRIINRFEKTITGQFYGHTHKDEFELFYDDSTVDRRSNSFDDLKATSVAWIGPSATTFTGLNPGYRIYEMDANGKINDYTTYHLNLTEANLIGRKAKLSWEKSFSALQDFGLKSLEPQELHNFIRNMIRDDKLFGRYYQYFFNKSDVLKTWNKCGSNKCKGELLCRLVSGKSHYMKVCRKLFNAIFDQF